MDPSSDNETSTALKSALWHSLGTTIEALSLSASLNPPQHDDDHAEGGDFNASSHFIGALSEMCWGQIETSARDLEGFARHREGGKGGKKGGRDADGKGVVIRAEDVVLLGRRDEFLEGVLRAEAERVRGEGKKG